MVLTCSQTWAAQRLRNVSVQWAHGKVPLMTMDNTNGCHIGLGMHLCGPLLASWLHFAATPVSVCIYSIPASTALWRS